MIELKLIIEGFETIEEIKDLIQIHQNLEKLEISTETGKFSEAGKNVIHETFQNEWNIEMSDDNGMNLSLKKKNATL